MRPGPFIGQAMAGEQERHLHQTQCCINSELRFGLVACRHTIFLGVLVMQPQAGSEQPPYTICEPWWPPTHAYTTGCAGSKSLLRKEHPENEQAQVEQRQCSRALSEWRDASYSSH